MTILSHAVRAALFVTAAAGSILAQVPARKVPPPFPFRDAAKQHHQVSHGVSSGYARPLAVVDVDGDGLLDLLHGSRPPHLQRNLGNLRFVDATSLLPARPNGTPAGCDVDGDGDQDLIDGTGRLTFQILTGITGAPLLVDVDGDRDLDLVTVTIAANQEGTFALSRNDGSGTFSTPVALAKLPDGPRAVAADFDLDGDVDLMLGTLVLRNDGSGGFTHADPTLPWLSGYSTGAEHLRHVVDVDADGDADVVQDLGRLFVNRRRDLTAPYVARTGRPFELRVELLPGSLPRASSAVVVLSASPAAVPLGGLGTLRVDLDLALALPLLQLPAPSGSASVTFLVPGVPALLGQDVFAQALLLGHESVLTGAIRETVRF